MDSTLKDFFNEINKITPAKKDQKKTDCVWQECFDENSGYAYYWNTTTDEVTWVMPEAYRLWKEKANSNSNKTSPNLYIPPHTRPSAFLSNTNVRDNLKIYKISECKSESPSVQNKEDLVNKSNELDYRKKEAEDENIGPSFENKKVVLVPSYELESESEEDHSSSIKSSDCEEGALNTEDDKLEECNSVNSELNTIMLTEESKSCEISNHHIMNDEIYKKLEKTQNKHYDDDDDDVEKKTAKRELSLVAGYGNSDEDDEEGEVTMSKHQNDKNNMKFAGNERDQQNIHLLATEGMFYQRKKRINLEYAETKKSTPISTGKGIDDHLGFGYNDSSNSLCCIKKKYMGFKSGGILFVSSDNSDSNREKEGDNSSNCEEENKSKCKSKILQDIEEISQTLSEKLRFLSEGREPTCAVQTLFIQMETLNSALKANCLSPKYLFDWLQDKCSELVKLEQSAAPAGWSLQWDRPNKRYFYYNRKTGENQWEYPHPQPNAIRSDEAMDICTTPPPPSSSSSSEETIRVDEKSLSLLASQTAPMLPPSPPTISKHNSPSPSPPPPPPPPYIGTGQSDNEISSSENKEWSKSDITEPLPPGVDFTEILKTTPSTISVHSNNRSKTPDNLGQELNSFYSDIAALDIVEPSSQSSGLCEIDGTEEAPKRKKKKVKIAEGLSLKKKGVSKLVEKWKNVQKDLNSSNQ